MLGLWGITWKREREKKLPYCCNFMTVLDDVFSAYLFSLYLESFFGAVCRNSLYTISHVSHPGSSFAKAYMSTQPMPHLHIFLRSSESLKCNLSIFTFHCTSLNSCMSSSIPPTSTYSLGPCLDITNLTIMYILCTVKQTFLVWILILVDLYWVS